MRFAPSSESCLFAPIASVVLGAALLLTIDIAVASDTSSSGPQSSGPACSCPEADGKSTRPKFADFTGPLDENDEIAALESIQMGLSRMDDGQPFVWRRPSGRLSGIVRPTASFRNAEGSICRHLVVLLTTGFKTRTAEGIACRMPNRRWTLEG